MTHGTHLPAALPADLELREALEKNGLRFTRQRAAVYQFLRSTTTHPTADEVHAAVLPRVPSMSLATVYKSLDALVETGLVNKISNVAGPCRYDCRHDAHYHFHCLDTREILDLPTPYDPTLIDKLDPQLVATLQRQGFCVTGYRLELLGFTNNEK
jgi:Fur family peroxide stress response transcriptional regulator